LDIANGPPGLLEIFFVYDMDAAALVLHPNLRTKFLQCIPVRGGDKNNTFLQQYVAETAKFQWNLILSPLWDEEDAPELTQLLKDAVAYFAARCFWPVFDKKVTTGGSHLCRAPLSPHSNGRIAVGFDPLAPETETFDYREVPTLEWLAKSKENIKLFRDKHVKFVEDVVAKARPAY